MICMYVYVHVYIYIYIQTYIYIYIYHVSLQAKQTRDKMLVDQVCAMIESRGGWTKSMAVEDFHLYLDSVEM